MPFFRTTFPDMWILLGQVSRPAPVGLSELVTFQLTGLVIVMTVLGTLWFGISMIGWLFKSLDWKDPSEVLPAAQGLSLTPDVKAVIAASLHVVMKEPFRVVSVELSKKD